MARSSRNKLCNSVILMAGIAAWCVAAPVSAGFWIATDGAEMTFGAGVDSDSNGDVAGLLDLTFNPNPSLDPGVFELFVGIAKQFTLGQITLDEVVIEGDEVDDLLPVTAILNFLVPNAFQVDNDATILSMALTGQVVDGADGSVSITFAPEEFISTGGSKFLFAVDQIFLDTNAPTQAVTANLLLVEAGDLPIDPPIVPEPASLALALSGALGMFGYGLRRRNQSA